jgi:hypothetical protein
MPADARHSVPAGITPFGGHVPAPSQSSATSQSPAAVRQSVPHAVTK